MDIYSTQKIKCTITSVGTLAVIVFYSASVDFHYIGPFIYNTLSEIKFLANTSSVNGRAIEKILLEINAIVYDTMSLFNGFNRSKIKEIKNLLSQEVIYNERLFIYLRGSNNKEDIMEICRDYTGGKQYKELIESETIKPKVKSDVKVIEPPKYGDEIKVEKNDKGIFKFLKFKHKVKKNLFLEADIDINEFPEYKSDYDIIVDKIKNLNSQGDSDTSQKEENDILDFANNKTDGNKKDDSNKKDTNFWEANDQKTESDNAFNNNVLNKENDFNFDFDFEATDKKVNVKKEQNKDVQKTVKEKNKEENKKIIGDKNKIEKKEIKKKEEIFDFKKFGNNMNNSLNQLKKVMDNNKNINKNNNENKTQKGNASNNLIDFDFPDDNKNNKINKKENVNNTNIYKNNNENKSKKGNESNILIDFDFTDDNKNNKTNKNQKVNSNLNKNNNEIKIQKGKGNDILIDFDFTASNKNDNGNKKEQTNNNLIKNNFNNINNVNNSNMNGFHFSAFNKAQTINNPIPIQNNRFNQSINFKDINANNKNNNNNGFNFSKANFSNQKLYQSNNFNNVKTPNQNNANNNFNNQNNNKIKTIDDLINIFSIGNSNPPNNSMTTQFSPPYPNNKKNN